jgi:colanic acid biosynthesis glycosyl transferase WcaI
VRILVVSQFFRPEPGAAQNRLGAFADGLVARGHEVTVVCEQPNHPAGVFHPGYGRRPLAVERRGALTVRRLWVAASPRKTMPRRALFYGSFAGGAFAAVLAARRPDVVLVTSPPLPPSLAAVAAVRARRLPLVLDVRDVWGIAVQAVDVGLKARLLRAIDRAERWLFAGADRVTAATRAFCAYIDGAVGRPISTYLPNGAADELLALPDRPRPDDGPLVVGYAGNFGLLHGLPAVIEAADRLRGEDVRFVLVGDGPLGEELRRERERRGLHALELRSSVAPEQVGEVLMGCDVLLSPLGPHAALDAVIPSKTYDAMAVGRPVITSARGEAAALVRDNACGIVVAPEDPDALAEAIRALARDRALGRRYGAAGREAARAHARSRQIDLLERTLRSAAAGDR